MLQKEVAERLSAVPGSKAYGVLRLNFCRGYDALHHTAINQEVLPPFFMESHTYGQAPNH